MIRYWKSKSKSTSYLINYPIVIITIISGYFCYRSERLIISNITMNIFTLRIFLHSVRIFSTNPFTAQISIFDPRHDIENAVHRTICSKNHLIINPHRLIVNSTSLQTEYRRYTLCEPFCFSIGDPSKPTLAYANARRTRPKRNTG